MYTSASLNHRYALVLQQKTEALCLRFLLKCGTVPAAEGHEILVYACRQNSIFTFLSHGIHMDTAHIEAVEEATMSNTDQRDACFRKPSAQFILAQMLEDAAEGGYSN